MATIAPHSPRPGLARRLLGSPVVDLLLGPHGVDRYLELISPTLTVGDARAEVVAVRRHTARSVTLTLRPNRAWAGFEAGQYVAVGVEIDGVRRTRTYSPAGSAHDRRELELTVTEHAGGLVSGHLLHAARTGSIVHLAGAQGMFTLPSPRPERIVLISGGSGITPVLSMLRTLADEGHQGEISFLHFARTEADWLYEPEVRAVVARLPGLRVDYFTTRGDEPRRLDVALLRELVGDAQDATAAVCGPAGLVDAAPTVWAELGGDAGRLLTETFMPPRVLVTGDAAGGMLRFLRSDRTAQIGDGTLLEQAEAAGLTPEFGCRMGICHTCTCRKAAGAVRNLRTGEVSEEENEDIQLCISAPAGDVALEL
ncbi:MAG TPA: ferredoxin reductase [Solirubrobacteraceae bacterium]|jgi:ferredoxin-NADP reductase|nr:ferredoxin reductase [Solirubrobacteraceae bacterium]